MAQQTFARIRRELSNRHPDKVFLFQTGDRLEAHGRDAQTVASACGLVLNMGDGASAMCGFPAREIDERVRQLFLAGNRVAVRNGQG